MSYIEIASKMNFPVAIFLSHSIWHISVPDLPLCTSSSKPDIHSAQYVAEKIIRAWISDALVCGKRIPGAKRIDDYVLDSRFQDFLWTIAVVRVPVKETAYPLKNLFFGKTLVATQHVLKK